jgi:hypothetical protein
MENKIEAAPTGRAKCRECRETIAKGVFRFGEAAASSFGEGVSLQWYHLDCAADRRPVQLKETLASYSGELPGRAELDAKLVNAEERAKLAPVVRAEPAPTGRAHCQQCHEAIAKGSLRIVIEREIEGGMPASSFVHAACARAYVGADGIWAKLEPRSGSLTVEERAELARVLS